MQYVFTDDSGKTKTLTQGDAEILLVARGACADAKAAKAKLAEGNDINLPAKGNDPAGVVGAKK